MLSLCKVPWKILCVHHLIPWRQCWHFWGITRLARDIGLGNCWWQPVEEVALGRGDTLPVLHQSAWDSPSPPNSNFFMNLGKWLSVSEHRFPLQKRRSAQVHVSSPQSPNPKALKTKSFPDLFGGGADWSWCNVLFIPLGMNMHFTEEISVCLITRCSLAH